MKSKFTISIHRNSDNLHLRLKGDFNDASGRELVNMIKKNRNGAQRIIIHTSCINKVYPFDREKFQGDLKGLNNSPARIVFTGEYAERITSQKSLCI